MFKGSASSYFYLFALKKIEEPLDSLGTAGTELEGQHAHSTWHTALLSEQTLWRRIQRVHM